MRKTILKICALGLISLAGCASYYQVTDPASGKIFYTREVKRENGGAIRIRDAGTGDEVTLQNSQVKQVTQEEFETNRAGKK